MSKLQKLNEMHLYSIDPKKFDQISKIIQGCISKIISSQDIQSAESYFSNVFEELKNLNIIPKECQNCNEEINGEKCQNLANIYQRYLNIWKKNFHDEATSIKKFPSTNLNQSRKFFKPEKQNNEKAEQNQQFNHASIKNKNQILSQKYIDQFQNSNFNSLNHQEKFSEIQKENPINEKNFHQKDDETIQNNQSLDISKGQEQMNENNSRQQNQVQLLQFLQNESDQNDQDNSPTNKDTQAFKINFTNDQADKKNSQYQQQTEFQLRIGSPQGSQDVLNHNFDNNQLTLGPKISTQQQQYTSHIQINAPFQQMQSFSSNPTTPRSTKYHDIGVQKIKEMLRDGGYKTFAHFGLELDEYEKSKMKLLQAHYNFQNSRMELDQSFDCFNDWIKRQTGPNYNLIDSNQVADNQIDDDE